MSRRRRCRATSRSSAHGARRSPAAARSTSCPTCRDLTPLLADLVRTIDDNGTLVVVHTSSGAAQVVAGMLDRARMPEVLGTIAGDDAIFIAPARGISTARVIKKLRDLVAR